jgi:hypothetical protein
MQQADRWTVKAGQEIDHAACRQMDREGKQEMDYAACREMSIGRTGDGSCSMRADIQRQGRRWISQHAGRCTKTGQEMDYTACRQMHKTQRQSRRCIIQHAGICTEARQEMDHTACQEMDRGKAGQEMDHTACWQMDRGRAGDGSYSMPADGQRQGRR